MNVNWPLLLSVDAAALWLEENYGTGEHTPAWMQCPYGGHTSLVVGHLRKNTQCPV